MEASDWMQNPLMQIPSTFTLTERSNIYIYIYTGCNRRNGPNFGRVFLRSNYTDITQNAYIQSSMVTEILAREKCDFFGVCILYTARDVILVVSA